MLKEKTVHELKQMIDDGSDFQLIDVREPHEFELANIGGEPIPMGKIIYEEEKIATDKPVVIHCRSGKRSAQTIMQLQTMHGFENLYNLKGGIIAWADEIDDTLPKYDF